MALVCELTKLPYYNQWGVNKSAFRFSAALHFALTAHHNTCIAFGAQKLLCSSGNCYKCFLAASKSAFPYNDCKGSQQDAFQCIVLSDTTLLDYLLYLMQHIHNPGNLPGSAYSSTSMGYMYI